MIETKKYQHFDILTNTYYWIELDFEKGNDTDILRITLHENDICELFEHSHMIFDTIRDRVGISRNRWYTYLNMCVDILDMSGCDIKKLNFQKFKIRNPTKFERFLDFFRPDIFTVLVDRKILK